MCSRVCIQLMLLSVSVNITLHSTQISCLPFPPLHFNARIVDKWRDESGLLFMSDILSEGTSMGISILDAKLDDPHPKQ